QTYEKGGRAEGGLAVASTVGSLTPALCSSNDENPVFERQPGHQPDGRAADRRYRLGQLRALGAIVRTDDGTRQGTYNGMPLYFFSRDNAAGDANGVYPVRSSPDRRVRGEESWSAARVPKDDRTA